MPMTIAPWCPCCTATLTPNVIGGVTYGLVCANCRVYLFCQCGSRFCIPHQQISMAEHQKDCAAKAVPSERK